MPSRWRRAFALCLFARAALEISWHRLDECLCARLVLGQKTRSVITAALSRPGMTGYSSEKQVTRERWSRDPRTVGDPAELRLFKSCQTLGQLLSNRCFRSRGSAQCRTKLDDGGQALGFATLGKHQPEFGRHLANIGQSMAKLRRDSTNVGRCWPNSGPLCPSSARRWPASVNVGRNRPTFGQS